MESPENGDGDGMETPKTCRTRLCHVRSFLANLGISEDAMVPCHPGWASWCQKCGHGESLSSGIEFATCYRKHATSTCNILQHLATSCNILQHLATWVFSLSLFLLHTFVHDACSDRRKLPFLFQELGPHGWCWLELHKLCLANGKGCWYPDPGMIAICRNMSQ